MALSWEDQLLDFLSQSTEDSEAIEVADACRTESDDEQETANVWWVPLLKSHLAAHQPPSPTSHQRDKVKVVSACCGCCSEAECFQAGHFLNRCKPVDILMSRRSHEQIHSVAQGN